MGIQPQCGWYHKLSGLLNWINNEKSSERRDSCLLFPHCEFNVRRCLKVFLPCFPKMTAWTFKLRARTNPRCFKLLLFKDFLTEMRKVTKPNSNLICWALDCWNRDGGSVGKVNTKQWQWPEFYLTSPQKEKEDSGKNEVVIQKNEEAETL